MSAPHEPSLRPAAERFRNYFTICAENLLHNTRTRVILVFMPLPIRIVVLRPGDRARLQRLTPSRTLAHRMVQRAHIILASADGESGRDICARCGVSRPTVTAWLDRYEADGYRALMTDRPRSGRPPQISPAEAAAIIKRTLHTRPPSGTHWSVRGMAQVTGHAPTTIARLWRTHGVTPPRGTPRRVTS